jgi:hypothetical protein
MTRELATVWSGHGDGAVSSSRWVVERDAPCTLVHQSVVVSAQKHSVGEVACAAVLPGNDMVRVSVRGRPMAPWPSAAAVSRRERLALVGREESMGASEIYDCSFGIEQQRREVGVAGDSGNAGRVQHFASGCQVCATITGNHNMQVGSFTARLRHHPRITCTREYLHQSVCSPLRRTSRRVWSWALLPTCARRFPKAPRSTLGWVLSIIGAGE